MAHRGQESQSSYVDGIFVKISEKYKPPPRINLAFTYSQRLSLNKQIQDMTGYDFTLEKSVKEKILELSNIRKEDAKVRLEKFKKARTIYEENRLKKKKDFINKDNEIFVSSSELEDLKMLQGKPVTNANSDILYSTSYSNILTPTPLLYTSPNLVCSANDKSPLNIEEFEADTSSPFDNMELKSINDIEELAQVLKKDKIINSSRISTTLNQSYSNYVPPIQTSTQGFSGQLKDPLYLNSHLTNTNPQTTIPNFSLYTNPLENRHASNPFSNLNGYSYPSNHSDTIPTYKTESFNLKTNNMFANAIDNSKPQVIKNTLNSVPNIMKSLQAQLSNTNIDSNASKITLISTEKNNSVVNNKDTAKPSKDTAEDNEYELLPANLQQLSRSISSMGFPLSRVTRVCRLLGDDHKKVIEHLLVMSELLDLGFSEKDVSAALIRCDNDRDKALDILIS